MDGLWRQVLDWKYGLQRCGWEVKEAPNKAFTIWRGILSVKKIFLENVKYKVGSGENVIFWKDRRVDDRTLEAQFPNLYDCVVHKEATINSYMTRVTG